MDSKSLTLDNARRSYILDIVETTAKLSNGFINRQTEIDTNLLTSIYMEKYGALNGEQFNADVYQKLADISAVRVTHHPDYYRLANKFMVSHARTITKTANKSFSDIVTNIQKTSNYFNDNIFKWILTHKVILNAIIVNDADYKFDYIGIKYLLSRYMIKNRDTEIPMESIQSFLMREAIGVSNVEHLPDAHALQYAVESYIQLYNHKFTHATPTLLNACSNVQQLLSCFILQMDDSIEGIMKTLEDASIISKWSGGVGIGMNAVRGRNAPISGHGVINGKSKGTIPILKIAQECARTWDQGGNKRPGSFSPYMPIWHSDILLFVKSTSHNTDERMRATDLFHAIWACDLFFERLKDDQQWTLFDPKKVPKLFDTYGEEFNALYHKYEEENLGTHKVQASAVFSAICESMCERGIPYICSNDAANTKTNHSNIGTIRSSNLCAEIFEYSSPTEYACCTLASINLTQFFDKNQPYKFNFDELYRTTRIVTRNLNNVIDTNYYPVPETKVSNEKYRPIAIGIQGLANVFSLMRVPFTSPEARQVNRYIAETIYFAALSESTNLSRHQAPYSFYDGSPVSKRILQYDMWNDKPKFDKWNWQELKKDIQQYGVRNSLLIAYMPTASTSHIFQNRESFEPFNSNIYQRHSNLGQFMIFNQHMVDHLTELNLWNETMANKIINNDGSLTNIQEIPKSVQEIYKTIWEIKQMHLIDMAADRAPFVDQSQSLNLYVPEVTYKNMKKLILHAQSRGLKTLSYYVNSKPATTPEKTYSIQQQSQEKNYCDKSDPSCESCQG